MRVFLIVACAFFVASVQSVAQQSPLIALKDQSFMTYSLVHPLHRIEATSKAVEYALVADYSAKTIKQVTAQVDVSTFDSGNSNRDSHAMEVIDAITYPVASFASTSIAEKGDSLTVLGKLTFHGVTKDVVALATDEWAGDHLDVNGKMDISLTSFGVERPSLMMIPVQDTLFFSFKAVFSLHPVTQ